MPLITGATMNTSKNYLTYRTATAILILTATSFFTQAKAADLACTGPQMGEMFINTTTGIVTKSAEESIKVKVSTEKSHYRFVYKGKISQFKATINRATGEIILDDACTPQCWGGPIFGICTTIKAKF